MKWVGIIERMLGEAKDVCKYVDVGDRYEANISDCDNETGNQVSKWHLLVGCLSSYI